MDGCCRRARRVTTRSGTTEKTTTVAMDGQSPRRRGDRARHQRGSRHGPNPCLGSEPRFSRCRLSRAIRKRRRVALQHRRRREHLCVPLDLLVASARLVLLRRGLHRAATHEPVLRRRRAARRPEPPARAARGAEPPCRPSAVRTASRAPAPVPAQPGAARRNLRPVGRSFRRGCRNGRSRRRWRVECDRVREQDRSVRAEPLAVCRGRHRRVPRRHRPCQSRH